MKVGLLGRKVGMTQIYEADGTAVPVTILECGPFTVLQVRTNDVKSVDVVGFSKGRGAADFAKRHGFKGLRAVHGVKRMHRRARSAGSSSGLSAFHKSVRESGDLGKARVTVRNLNVVRVDPANNLLLVGGAVPGPNGGYVTIRESLRGPLPPVRRDREPAVEPTSPGAGVAPAPVDSDRVSETPLAIEGRPRAVASPIKVGSTVYPLRAPLEGRFLPGTAETRWEFHVTDLLPEVVGLGASRKAAFHDWRDQIHERFQKLRSKRPFEMTETESATWRSLLEHIDLDAYEKANPPTIRQIGRVVAARPGRLRVEWEDGQGETVRFEQAPAEFATYQTGDWFESIVERDSTDFHFRKIVHMHKTKPPVEITPAEIEELMRRIPTTATLPNAGWD